MLASGSQVRNGVCNFLFETVQDFGREVELHNSEGFCQLYDANRFWEVRSELFDRDGVKCHLQAVFFHYRLWRFGQCACFVIDQVPMVVLILQQTIDGSRDQGRLFQLVFETQEKFGFAKQPFCLCQFIE